MQADPDPEPRAVSQPLRTATAIVGLLAGIVAAVYVVGGLVIALRLLVDGFEPGSVAAILGQLPRELVISTALLDVGLPAAILGLVAAGFFEVLRGFDRAPIYHRNNPREVALVALISLLLVLVGALPILGDASRGTVLLAVALGWFCTVFVASGSWLEVKRFARDPRWTFRIGVVGGACALAATIPAVLFAAGVELEHAQACVEASSTPERGRLIGEGDGQLLLAQKFGDEESVVSISSDRVIKTEYGDLSSSFSCADADSIAAKGAEIELGGHGGELERRLAAELRPRLRFDAGERWRPLEVGAFLAERAPRRAGQRFCRGDPAEPRCEAATGLDQLRRGREAPAFIDIAGEIGSPATFRAPAARCRVEPPALDCNDGPRTVIYYRRTTHEGRWYWDYWWFMRFNDYAGRFNDCFFYCADHEGDWEGVTVITTASTEPELLGAVYAAHKDRILVDAAILPRSGTHPVVFVARGTHASYPFRCGVGRSCRQFGTLVGFRLPEESHDGEVAWGGNVDAACAATACVRPLPEVGRPGEAALPLAGDWAGWTGKWGRTCVNRCKRAESSPNSPGLQTRFRCPWAPTHVGLLSREGTVSKAERAGDAERIRARCFAQRAGL